LRGKILVVIFDLPLDVVEIMRRRSNACVACSHG